MSQSFTRNVLLDTDPIFTGNSDYIAPSQSAVKSALDAKTHNSLSGLNVGDYQHLTTAQATLVSKLGDGITAGKTLTLTAVDNFNFTIPATGTAALLGSVNVFTAINSFTVNTNSSDAAIASRNTSTGTAAQSRFQLFCDRTSAEHQAWFGIYNSGNTVSAFGETLADWSVFLSSGTLSKGLILGTAASTPLHLATNTTKRISIANTGPVTIHQPVNYAADAQASDTYVITLAPALLAYTTGLEINFKANTANTGAASINVNGLGAKTIVKAVSTALANNDILAGMFCKLIYDGTNFVLLNPRTL